MRSVICIRIDFFRYHAALAAEMTMSLCTQAPMLQPDQSTLYIHGLPLGSLLLDNEDGPTPRRIALSFTRMEGYF